MGYISPIKYRESNAIKLGQALIDVGFNKKSCKLKGKKIILEVYVINEVKIYIFYYFNMHIKIFSYST